MDRDRKIQLQVNIYDGMEVHSLTHECSVNDLMKDHVYEMHQIAIPIIKHLRDHEVECVQPKEKKRVSLPIHWIKGDSNEIA